MATAASTRVGTTSAPMTAEEKKVIFASSLGTVFEWYDFYLYGSLAPIIAKQFFSAWTRRRRSSLRCWPLPRASSCAPSARWCLAAWAT